MTKVADSSGVHVETMLELGKPRTGFREVSSNQNSEEGGLELLWKASSSRLERALLAGTLS